MRALLLLGLAASAACFSDRADDGQASNYPPNGAPMLACAEDRDCVPAALTCCECATFAVNALDPINRVCVGFPCPGGGGGGGRPGCPEVTARCNADRICELSCVPRACAASCPDGFARDANGCLTCECAPPEPGGCTADAECVRTREDCCGCALGGFDTAVLASQREAYEAERDAELMCSLEPRCPGVDTCTADAPACVQGRCELVPPLPVGACGRADLPACPPGLECVVNASEVATARGVGICAPPP